VTIAFSVSEIGALSNDENARALGLDECAEDTSPQG
jgi:hypothetical protein